MPGITFFLNDGTEIKHSHKASATGAFQNHILGKDGCWIHTADDGKETRHRTFDVRCLRIEMTGWRHMPAREMG